MIDIVQFSSCQFQSAILIFCQIAESTVFPTGCLGLALSPCLFFCLHCFLTSWVFEAWEEHFQNSYSLIIFKTNWEKTRRFWLQITSFYKSFLWLMWIWNHPNGMEVHPWSFMKSQDEIKFIQEIKSIILLSSMKCNLFTISFFS
jgi:hypothetical protein